MTAKPPAEPQKNTQAIIRDGGTMEIDGKKVFWGVVRCGKIKQESAR